MTHYLNQLHIRFSFCLAESFCVSFTEFFHTSLELTTSFEKHIPHQLSESFRESFILSIIYFLNLFIILGKVKSSFGFLLIFQNMITLCTFVRFKSNMRRFGRKLVANEMPTSLYPSRGRLCPYYQNTRRTNFHRPLLRPTSHH